MSLEEQKDLGQAGMKFCHREKAELFETLFLPNELYQCDHLFCEDCLRHIFNLQRKARVRFQCPECGEIMPCKIVRALGLHCQHCKRKKQKEAEEAAKKADVQQNFQERSVCCNDPTAG